MGSESNKTYEVGYKKPPKSTQFQKGRSGNASGRPKKAFEPIDTAKILEAIENEEITRRVDGKWKSLTKREIRWRKLFEKAIKTDLSAARHIVKRAIKCLAPQHPGSGYGIEVMSETEATKRFGRNWQKHVEEHNARLGI